jgi:hypothetical protein
MCSRLICPKSSGGPIKCCRKRAGVQNFEPFSSTDARSKILPGNWACRAYGDVVIIKKVPWKTNKTSMPFEKADFFAEAPAMANEIKVNRRRWHRKPVQIPAQYFIKNQSTRYLDCTVISLSRNGAAVLFPTYEFLKAKVFIFIDIMVPKTLQKLTLRGELKTKHRNQSGLVGGIQFVNLLQEDMFSKLT